MFIGALFVCTLAFDVGRAANVTEKEPAELVLNDLSAFVGYNDVIVIENHTAFTFENLVDFNLVPVADGVEPLSLEVKLGGSYVPYKEKGQLKAKYHPWYLFNPLKLC